MPADVPVSATDSDIRIMKRYLLLLLSLAVLGFSQVSCVMYSDEDYPEDPSFKVAQIFYNGNFEHLFRVSELVVFFSEYQGMRDDRPASEALWRTYFGDAPVSLDYEKASVYDWGTVTLSGEPDTYVVSSDAYMEGNRKYVVAIAGDGTMHVDVYQEGSDGLYFSAEMSLADGKVSIVGLDYMTEDQCGTTVSVSVGEPLSMPVCSEGAYSHYPHSGILEYSISGEVNDSFRVRYSSEGCVIRHLDGTETSYDISEN